MSQDPRVDFLLNVAVIATVCVLIYVGFQIVVFITPTIAVVIFTIVELAIKLKEQIAAIAIVTVGYVAAIVYKSCYDKYLALRLIHYAFVIGFTVFIIVLGVATQLGYLRQ